MFFFFFGCAVFGVFFVAEMFAVLFSCSIRDIGGWMKNCVLSKN